MSIVIEELRTTEDEIQLPVFSTEPEPAPSPIPTPTIVTWDGPSDPHNPFNWSPRKKWLVITLALFASFISSMNGTILSVAHNPINTEFHISDSHFPNSYWPIASWGVGGAIFSLVLFPVMEDFGIRPVFLGTYLLFVASLIPIGFARNFETLVVVRFFSGGCVQLLSNAVAGVISNVWRDDRERSVPISLYVTTYLVSTSMGPVIGSAILEYLDWRWIGHVELIWTVAFFPLFIFCLPESRGSAILLAKAKRQRKEGREIYTAEEFHKQPMHKILIKSVQRPLYMLLTESVVFIATLWAAFSLGTMYLFTQSVEQVYSQLYNWNSLQAGYVQLAIAIGECVGCLLCMYTNPWYHDSASRNTEVPGTPIPEARLYPSVIGGFLGVTGGMFLYGWTSLSSLHWLIPTTGLFLVGFGTSAIIISNANYLVDAYSKYATSALGAVGLVENIALAFIPLASERMYTDLRFQWASSLLGFVSLGLVATPFAVFRWGKVIRGRSPFMKEAVLEKRGLMVGDEGMGAGVGVREV